MSLWFELSRCKDTNLFWFGVFIFPNTKKSVSLQSDNLGEYGLLTTIIIMMQGRKKFVAPMIKRLKAFEEMDAYDQDTNYGIFDVFKRKTF